MTHERIEINALRERVAQLERALMDVHAVVSSHTKRDFLVIAQARDLTTILETALPRLRPAVAVDRVSAYAFSDRL
jgi:hypothetical protein